MKRSELQKVTFSEWMRLSCPYLQPFTIATIWSHWSWFIRYGQIIHWVGGKRVMRMTK